MIAAMVVVDCFGAKITVKALSGVQSKDNVCSYLIVFPESNKRLHVKDAMQ